MGTIKGDDDGDNKDDRPGTNFESSAQVSYKTLQNLMQNSGEV